MLITMLKIKLSTLLIIFKNSINKCCIDKNSQFINIVVNIVLITVSKYDIYKHTSKFWVLLQQYFFAGNQICFYYNIKNNKKTEQFKKIMYKNLC